MFPTTAIGKALISLVYGNIIELLIHTVQWIFLACIAIYVLYKIILLAVRHPKTISDILDQIFAHLYHQLRRFYAFATSADTAQRVRLVLTAAHEASTELWVFFRPAVLAVICCFLEFACMGISGVIILLWRRRSTVWRWIASGLLAR